MKKALLLAPVFILSIGLVHAQSLGPAGYGQGQTVFAPCALGPDDITQSLDCSIEPFTGIACNGAFTTDTHNLRRFFLTADHGIIDEYTVDEVQFGVEVDDLGAGVGNPITVNVHAIPIGAAFTFANMGAPLDSVVVDLDGNTDFTIVTAVMNGTAVIDPATDDLVVDYLSFDHNDAFSGGNFFPGANMLGETQPTYLAADDCSIFEPTTLADLGFPGTAYVVIVNGTEGGDPCMAKYIGQPRAVRTDTGVEVRFSLGVIHNRAPAQVPVTATLEDSSGNVYASLDMGIRSFMTGESVRLNGVLKAPGALSPGDYILTVRMQKMKGFETRRHIVSLR